MVQAGAVMVWAYLSGHSLAPVERLGAMKFIQAN
jgi:hypothetical protein